MQACRFFGVELEPAIEGQPQKALRLSFFRSSSGTLISRLFRGQSGKDLGEGLGGSEPSRGRDCSRETSKTRGRRRESGLVPSLAWPLCPASGGEEEGESSRSAARGKPCRAPGLLWGEGAGACGRLTRGASRLVGWGAISLRIKALLWKELRSPGSPVEGLKSAWGTLAGKARPGTPLQRLLENTGCRFKNRVPREALEAALLVVVVVAPLGLG